MSKSDDVWITSWPPFRIVEISWKRWQKKICGYQIKLFLLLSPSSKSLDCDDQTSLLFCYLNEKTKPYFRHTVLRNTVLYALVTQCTIFSHVKRQKAFNSVHRTTSSIWIREIEFCFTVVRIIIRMYRCWRGNNYEGLILYVSRYEKSRIYQRNWLFMRWHMNEGKMKTWRIDSRVVNKIHL